MRINKCKNTFALLLLFGSIAFDRKANLLIKITLLVNLLLIKRFFCVKQITKVGLVLKVGLYSQNGIWRKKKPLATFRCNKFINILLLVKPIILIQSNSNHTSKLNGIAKSNNQTNKQSKKKINQTEIC